MTRSKTPRKLTASSFEALPDSQKNLVLAEIESLTPAQRLARSRPLNDKERAQWKAFQKKARAGRPKIGKGSQVISLSVEKSLLKRIDAYAKANGLGRSEFFVRTASEKIGA